MIDDGWGENIEGFINAHGIKCRLEEDYSLNLSKKVMKKVVA